MSDQNEENILYGGPLTSSIDVNYKSLGEMMLHKLTIRGDDLMYVSRKQLLKLLYFDYLFCYGNFDRLTVD